MIEPTTIQKALQLWQRENPAFDLENSLDVQLQFQWPPIEKMDGNLSVLKKCQKLSLSTNMIKRISGLGELKNLKILSLARNSIRYLDGIECLADTLEELWISYNMISKLTGIGSLKKLKVLYIGNNSINDWNDVEELGVLKNSLKNLMLKGNPFVEKMEVAEYRNEMKKKYSFLNFLDGRPLISD